jgi:hypothetical protein
MKVLKDLAVSGQITVGQLLQSSIDTDKFIVSDGGVAKFRTGSQLLGDIDGVINTRTITINGTAQDLTANRSFTVGDVRTDGSYANPAWITSLAWSKITGAPAFITGNQNITLSGDVTGSGATSIVTTIANNAVTTAKINNGAVTAAKLATFGAGEGIYWAANTDGASITFESTGDGGSGGRALSNLLIALTDNGDEGLKVTTTGAELLYVNINQFQYKGSNVWTAANLTNLNQLTNGPGYITGYTETDTLSSVTARGSSTSTAVTFSTSATIGRVLMDFDGTDSFFRMQSGNRMRITTTGGTDFIIPNTGNMTYNGNTVWHAGNLTNLNQLTNGPGYITSYTETDTLATVTGRGASTSTALSLNGGVTITGPNAWNAATPMLSIGGTGDGRMQVRHIWGKEASTANPDHLWLQYTNSTFGVQIGASGGSNPLYVAGDIYMGGYFGGNLVATRTWVQSQGYVTGSYLPLAGGTMTGNVQFNANLLQFNNGGVRSWNMGISGGNLNVYSGDGSGSLLYNGRPLRDSYYRTYSGFSDYYGGGTGGWYRVAQITLTGNCSGSVLYGTLYDNRYDGADSYQIAVVARADCDFTSNNESHYINVGCSILGSTYYTDYRSKIRVVLTGSSSGSRTYELQFYESPWNHDTWQIETTGWTVYTSPQVANASTGTPRVNYISNHNADYIRANTAVYSPVYYDSSNTQYYLDGNVSGGWRIGTPSGYLDLGPLNSGFCHFQTDRDKFYFNKRVEVDGELHRYGGSRFVENTGTWSISVTGSAGSLSSMNISQFTNNSGYITSTNTDFTYSASLTLSTSWQNTGVTATQLSTSGVYIVTCALNDFAVSGGQYSETYVGLMYWYASGTNSNNAAEIPLHHSGHADNDRYIYLRTLTDTGAATGKIYLQIKGNGNNSGASTYSFTFKRLL